MRKKGALIILFLMGYGGHILAQSAIDSLRERGTNSEIETSEQVAALNRLVSTFMRSFQKDSMIFYSDIAVEKARTAGDKELLLSALYYNAIAYDRVNPDKMRLVLQEYLQIAEGLGDQAAWARGLKMESDLASDDGDLEEAILLLTEAIQILEPLVEGDSTGAYARWIGQYRHNIASKHYSMQHFDQALEIATLNEEYAKEIGYQDLQLRVGQMIAAIYSSLAVNAELNNLQLDTQKYYQLSIEYAKDFLKKAIELNHLRFEGYGYSTVGNSYMKLGQLDSAKYYLSKSIPIALQTQEYDGYANRLNLLGGVEFELRNFERAEEHFLTALEVARDIKDPVVEVQILNNLAKTSIEAGRLNTARSYAAQSIDLSLRIKRYGSTAIAYGYLKELEEQSGNLSAALDAYENQVQYQDSIEKSENLARFEELQTKYETEKIEAENELLVQQGQLQALQIRNRNIQIVLAVALLLLVSAGGFFWYRIKLSRQQKIMQDANQRLLTLQMNPHFLFNTLVTIQSFVIQNRDRLEVADFIAEYAKVTRVVLEFSRKTLVSLQEEIELLKDFLTLQQVRTSNKFEYEFVIDEALEEISNIYLPPLVAQPFIENAIEHGIIPSSVKGGKIRIEFKKHGERMRVLVEDNGAGISPEGSSKSHKSLSTKITDERFALLQQLTKKSFTYQIVNKMEEQEGKGVRVEFEIPILTEKFKEQLTASLTI